MEEVNVQGEGGLVQGWRYASARTNRGMVQQMWTPVTIFVQRLFDHHNCLEIIALKGKASQLKKLSDKLNGQPPASYRPPTIKKRLLRLLPQRQQRLCPRCQ